MDKKALLILIIAAGSSSRLGRPKQLLPYKNGTLLSHTIENCISAGIGTVRLVLGSNAEEIRNSLADYPIEIVENINWKNGMGSSIAFGLKDADEDMAGVMVVLSDQPYLTERVLKNIIEASEKAQDAIIASQSTNYSGPPVYFPVKFLDRLKQLNGDKGAKSIIRSADQVAYVDFPNGHIDIDTPEDLYHLKNID